MSQQINLFEGGLVKARDWFTLPLLAVVYVLAAAVMLYWYTGLQSENAALMVQREQANHQYIAMQKKVEEFSARITPVDNSKLEAELNALKAKLEMQVQILAMFQQSVSDASFHLIDYMRAFTAQQQAGVWLTGFKLEPGSAHLSLSGQALQTEDIPAYLDVLSKQQVFAGTQFSGIQFKQVELHKRQSQAGGASAVPATADPAESAAVAKEAKPGQTNAAPAAVAPASTPASATVAAESVAVLKVYHFEVKGQDLQNPAKPLNGLSWDEFVRQTTAVPAGSQP